MKVLAKLKIVFHFSKKKIMKTMFDSAYLHVLYCNRIALRKIQKPRK